MDLLSRTFHHLHFRIRKKNNKENFYNKNNKKEILKSFLDKIIYIVGILGPLFTLPQAYTIYSLKTAEGVSIISWIWYFISSIIWLIYGIIHGEKPLIFTNIGWVITNILVLVGIFIY